MFREPFLQSPQWQKFQEANGKTCVSRGFGLGVIEALPIVGNYVYLPRGPVLDVSSIKHQVSSIEEELTHLAKEHKAGWIRVEPGSIDELETLRSVFSDCRIVPAPHDVQPREILVMNIDSDENTLLAQMKSKTRYNVRLAEKQSVSIRFSRAASDIELFIDLIYATTERKSIRPHPKQYYRNFFTVFSETECVLALAEHEGKVLAVNLLVFHAGATYYLHGGSSDEGRHLMAPYLLQWESIREAKQRGCTLYNFGGVSTKGDHGAWAGITRFKQGFAPATASMIFPGTYDIILSPGRYFLYNLLRKLQNAKKRMKL